MTDDKGNIWTLQDVEALFEKAPIGVAVVSDQGCFLRANQQLCSLLEYTNAELVNRRFDEVTHTSDIKTDWHEINLCLSNQSDGYTLLKKYISKSDKIIPAYLHVKPIKIEKHVHHFISFVIPVDVVDAKDGHELNAVDYVSDHKIVEFLKSNWLKIITAFGLVFGGVSQYYKNKAESETKQNQIQDRLQKAEKRDEEMKKILEKIEQRKDEPAI